MRLPRPSKAQTSNARRLRRTMSESQKKLWQQLRHHKTGFHFKREVPLEQFTLDFYCHEAKLCVEVDGQQHDDVRDAARDALLEQQSITTVRFASRECFKSPERVAARVKGICIERTGRDPDRPPP